MPRYFTLQQAAREVRVHTMVIYRAIRSGQLHATREPALSGNDAEVLVSQDCLRAWLDNRRCHHADAPHEVPSPE